MTRLDRGFPLGEREPIAIVGMSCTLPGGNNSPEDFFSFLLRKQCGISEIPADRWGVDVFYDPNPDSIGKSVSKWAGFIDDLRGFDAKFFGISPREAQGMDPQQRLVLQAAVDAMLDAQIPMEEFSRQSTGVFIGVSQSDYRSLQEMRLTATEAYAGTGYALCINANRISHRLNLCGPSYAVDTACSSSLTALNQAVWNLRSGACDMALVGGVNAMAHPSPFMVFSKAGMISPTGRISTFDAAANGFVRGEGVGMVVIKSLSRAQADGDRIHAIIDATVANQDGATNTITAPSQQAQIAMLSALFEESDITPAEIGFVEAHGTGTPVGDPIEAGAIGTIIGQNAPDRPVFIGSCKANVGHLESGAGITGLIKAAMAVKTGTVPPNIHFKTPNPHIPFDALNLEVPVQPEAFPEADGRRHAVVNSFGFGGANACALLSSPPPISYDHHPVPAMPVAQDSAQTSFPFFFPISGATEPALRANAASLLKGLAKTGNLADVPLSDLSAALATKRSHLMYRAAILARSPKDLKSALRKLAAGETDAPNIVTGQKQGKRKLCFTFAGQGSQWWGMARDLLQHNATFRNAVEAFDAEFQPVSGFSIKEELLRDQDMSRIDDTTVTQPALFAIQSGLAAVWRDFGVSPDMVVGHSIGEAAASYLAGGLSLAGAARFLSKRGVIRDQLGKQGAMAAIGLNVQDVEALLPDHGKLGIAAINGPGSTTISGDYDALHDFVEEFQMMNPDTFIRALTVDTAWHSYHLDAGEDWFRREMETIDWSVPHIPFLSTVTGKPETRFDTDYGWLNLRRPVNFQGGIEAALLHGATTFLELGPAATLAGPTRSTALEAGASVSVLNSLSRKAPDFETMAQSAAALFVQGIDLDWPAITGQPTCHVELPANAWQSEPFWQGSEESDAVLFKPVKHPFLGQRAQGNSTSWMSELNLRAYAYLKDHRLQSDVIFPAAGYIDTIIAMCREQFGAEKTIEIEDAVIHEALFIDPEEEILFSSLFDPERGKVKLYSRVRDANDDWVLRSEARVRVTDVKAPPARPFDPDRKGMTEIDTAYAYSVDETNSVINYGDAFQTIDQLWMTSSKTFARVVLKDGGKSTRSRHHIHPTMLDGCLQILEPRMTLKKIRRGRQPGDPVCLPIGVGRLRVFGDFPDEVFVEADQIKQINDLEPTAGFTVRDCDGRVLMSVERLKVSLLPNNKAESAGDEVPAHFVRQDLVTLREEEAGADPVTGRWLLLEGGSQSDADLAGALSASGAEVSRVTRSDLGEDIRGGLIDLAADAIETGDLAGIAVAWPLALADVSEDSSTDDLFGSIDRCTKDLIALGDLLDFARSGENGLPEIVVLTSGAYPASGSDGQDGRILTQMPVVAVARGMATETPEYRIRLLDADAPALSDPSALAARILRPGPETEVILRDGACLVPRLRHAESDDFDWKLLSVPKTDKLTNFHATMKSPGVIDHVGLTEIPLQPMGPDEVRVRISAVGLNFRDIMAVTGLLPTEAEPKPAWENLGLEYGGVVEAVGENVAGFKPGDRVMGLGKRCLQRFMTVNPNVLTLLPDHISLAQAATIPSAFATAHYALNHVGRMRAGEKVFIHVATGGVGTAAVQLAQAAGAEIFATAGNPEKRRLLKDLGVPHVMDSRSLKFADDVMRITKGTGVDILLNSLPGAYIAKGLDIMAPYGRYLEIGKRDVYEDAAIGMKALRRNVSLSVLDLAAMGEERPELLAEMFQELIGMLDSQALSPLPYTEFPISQIGDAIRYMSQAKHVGKVVVTLEEDAFLVRRDMNRPVSLSENGSYLITGGTAGFSLKIADWLSKAGAGRIVLASRSGKTDAAGERFIATLRARGTQVDVAAVDITDTSAVSDFVRSSLNSDTPLKGVVHGAAVIKDGFANQLTDDMITEVLAPKVRGGWNLHRAFAEAGVEPEFLIGFSSISQVIGSAGQCNYVAANAFLDALAHYRTALGRPGTAIDWGAIADAGFVARNAALASYLETLGLHGLKAKDFPAAMDLSVTREAPSFVYSRADWAQIMRANPALGSSPRMASALLSEGGAAQEVRITLMQLDGEALVAAARDYIMDEISSVLKIDKSTIQSDRPMSELGLDSLSSFELKIRIETALDFSLPVSKFLQAPSVDELSKMLGGEIEAIKRSEAAARDADETADEQGAVKTANTGALASNGQLGLLQLARAPMTSDAARRAMEHVVEAPLADEFSIKDLEKALRKLERRHPLLRIRFDTDGQLHLDGQATRIVETRDDSLLDVASGEFLRLTVADQRLRVRMHAIMGDETSGELILTELLGLLSGKKLVRAMPKKAVLAALSACRYDAERADAQTDRAFWWYSLSAGASVLPFPRRSRALLPAGAGSNHGPASHVSSRIEGQHGEAALLLAFATALRKVTQSSGPVLIDRRQSLRGDLPDHAAVGPFEIDQPVRVPADSSDRIGRAGLDRTLRLAHRHRAFDSHAAAAEFAPTYAEWGLAPFQALFELSDSWSTVPPACLLHDVWLQVEQDGSTPRIRLNFDQDVMDKHFALDILNAVEAELAKDCAATSDAVKAPLPQAN